MRSPQEIQSSIEKRDSRYDKPLFADKSQSGIYRHDKDRLEQTTGRLAYSSPSCMVLVAASPHSRGVVAFLVTESALSTCVTSEHVFRHVFFYDSENTFFGPQLGFSKKC